MNAKGRAVSILSRQIGKTGEHTYTIKVQVDGMQVPRKLRLIRGEMVLDEKDYADDVALTLDERLIGEGPSRIQAVAVYADGMEVASPPINITIAYVP